MAAALRALPPEQLVAAFGGAAPDEGGAAIRPGIWHTALSFAVGHIIENSPYKLERGEAA
jgi:hypothetical protein